MKRTLCQGPLQLVPAQLKPWQALKPSEGAVGWRLGGSVFVQADRHSQMETSQKNVDAEYLHDDYASNLRHCPSAAQSPSAMMQQSAIVESCALSWIMVCAVVPLENVR